MAASKSTNQARLRTKLSRELAQLCRVADSLRVQPAQITIEERQAIDANFERDRVWRRVLLGSLARSGAELIEIVTGNREVALALAQAADAANDCSSRLRGFADMMESAGTRITLALCDREDMEQLLLEAKAADSTAEVAHG